MSRPPNSSLARGLKAPATSARDRVLHALSPMELADLLLFALLRRRAGSIVIEPTRTGHGVQYELGETCESLASLSHERGDAVVARLAMIAKLPLDLRVSRAGRLRLSLRGHGVSEGIADGEMLLSLRSTNHGLAMEIHALGQRPERLGFEPAPPNSAGAPGAPRIIKYRILDELGRGGMGVVYEAEHVALKKRVAIKVLHPNLARDYVLASQFLIEARAACRARHPGIVDVSDFGSDPDGRAYFVMELVPWPTLETLLKGGALEFRRALLLARRIASALHAASREGVVHRDLKPANIFVSPDDHVKIGDFGLARILDAETGPEDGLANRIIGTTGYMAPEQARGEPTDCRADLYALGCVLFEMLTGGLPFRSASVRELVELHAKAPLPRLVGPEGPLPSAIEVLVHRALAKSPTERYQTPAEMLKDLRGVARASARRDWRRWLQP
jgi:tRNA A-37 threonylcarbamoyl transferase component Bud32